MEFGDEQSGARAARRSEASFVRKGVTRCVERVDEAFATDHIHAISLCIDEYIVGVAADIAAAQSAPRLQFVGLQTSRLSENTEHATSLDIERQWIVRIQARSRPCGNLFI